MKVIYSQFSLLLLFAFLMISCQEEEKSVDVDPALFLTNGVNFTIDTVDATLSNGVRSSCYKITTIGLSPGDHEAGPWCPEHITDEADKGGIWFKDGKIYDVDGEFIKELAALYHDDFWKLYDDEGNINRITSKEDCLTLAGAQLVEKFKNYCIECLPEYIAGIKQIFLIPITPVKLDSPMSLGGRPKGHPGEGHPDNRPEDRPGGPPPGGNGGPPPGGKGGHFVRGIAFNGIAFDAPAPLHIILSGYTIPPLDKAGGHINMDAGYHYHAATGSNTKHIHAGDEHAAMIGYAMDGYGLYEQLNADGLEPQDLDECRGHYDDVRGYHYHVDAPGSNNFINCFSGAIVQE